MWVLAPGREEDDHVRILHPLELPLLQGAEGVQAEGRVERGRPVVGVLPSGGLEELGQLPHLGGVLQAGAM